MNIIVHRGSNQIGGSCIEVFTDNTRIILDIGQELPSLDHIIYKQISTPPKVQGLYQGEEKTIDAILVSHGHGDHIGLIGDINQEIPVYIGEMAADIFEVTAKFTGGVAIASPLKYLKSGEKFHVGDFKITPYLVDHSGFDAYAFLIEAHNKSIIYTGDFRDHGRKAKATDYFINHIPKGIDGLLIEGTMMSRVDEVIKTEEQIENEACELMKSTQGPIFVLQSSTNIDRLVSMYRAAKKSGRIFVMDIFTAHIVSQLSSSIPNPRTFKDVWVFYPYWLNTRMCKSYEGAKLMSEFSSKRISGKTLGENQYCMLTRESMLSDLQHMNNLDGGGVIYSKWSGYKEEEKTKLILDYARSKGMVMVDLHTSGHASMACIKKVIENSEPKKIIPIHTEKPELFGKKFTNVYVSTDGNMIKI